MTLSDAIARLEEAGIESAVYDAREIFRHFGGFPAAEVVLRNIGSDLPELISAVTRRAAREPLQYIIGEAAFYHESYFVSPHCLIPRSDTEILVDYAVHNIPSGGRFIDLCTGSGCIAISVLKNTERTTATAAELSPSALEIAEKNAVRNGVADRLTLLCRDVLAEPIEGRYHAVLSNPPYVTDSAYESLAPEIYHEPKGAFVGGADGGDFYRILTPMYKDMLIPGGFIAYEIGYDQAELIQRIAEENSMRCEIINDYSSNPRVAVLS